MQDVALLVIDMQKAYFKTDSLRKQQTHLVDKINELIHFTTERNGHTFNICTEHVKDKSTWTLNMLEDEQGFLFKGTDEVKNVPGVDVQNAVRIVKTRDSAFYSTILEETLRKRGIKTLILCGISIHSCIAQTASDAYAADFKVILAKDALADDKSEYTEMIAALLKDEYRHSIESNEEIKRHY